MVKIHMKKCSTVCIIRGTQSKITMSCHLIPTRMAVIKRLKITSVGEDVKRTLVHCCWEKPYGGSSKN
jgi:hypothetical protein